MLGRFHVDNLAYDAAMTKLQQLYEIYPPDPRATMPIAIRVDNWLFGSVSGIDPLSGGFEGDTRAQLQRAVAAMKHVLLAGGMRAINLHHIKVTSSGADAEYIESLGREFWALHEPDHPPPSRLPLSKFARLSVYREEKQLSPGEHIRLDFTAALGQSEWRGVMLSPTVAAPAEAVRIGPVLWAHNLTARDAVDGSMPPGGIAAQVESAFDNLERLLEREGISGKQLLRVAGYMRDLKDKDLLNDEMVKRFPEWSQKPVHKYVPAALPPGVEFVLQALAVDGAERRIIEIEGIKHNDPISLGAQAGNVFVSSRVQARLEPTAREQTARLIEEHARRLVEHIGGSLEDVTQLVWGVGDTAFESEVREECSRHWPPEGMPRLDVMHADFPHSPLPRLEFLALLKG